MGSPLKMLSPEPKFSPLTVSQSPVSRVQGNLTGTVRQIRDTVADIYNLIQKWNNSYLNGTSLLQDMIGFKVSSLVRAGESDHERIYPSGLMKKSEELDATYNELALYVKSMRTAAECLKGIRKFEDTKHPSTEPLFLTWPTSKFEYEGDMIVKAYEEELKVKKLVKENVCHLECQDTLSCFLPLWVHQCYITDDVNFRLEAMLKECGFR